jgi:SAM-dependent methyltransferase
MPLPTEKEVLHQSLRDFYNRDGDYFSEAREANAELTPERAHLLSWVKPEMFVLDVGCGPGDNGRHLQTRVRYMGCDLSSIALRMAREILPQCQFTMCESQELPFASASFDAVLSTYSLEHFVFPEESLDEMWRVCRPGGLVLLISPAYDDPRLLPPSVSHWTKQQRIRIILQQAWRQLKRHLIPSHYDFACVTQPRVLGEAYQSDFDAVHLVSAREISNFFRAKEGAILFERRRLPRQVTTGSLPMRLREHARNLLLRLHIGEYAGLNLQIIVQKGKQ